MDFIIGCPPSNIGTGSETITIIILMWFYGKPLVFIDGFAPSNLGTGSESITIITVIWFYGKPLVFIDGFPPCTTVIILVQDLKPSQ